MEAWVHGVLRSSLGEVCGHLHTARLIISPIGEHLPPTALSGAVSVVAVVSLALRSGYPRVPHIDRIFSGRDASYRGREGAHATRNSWDRLPEGLMRANAAMLACLVCGCSTPPPRVGFDPRAPQTLTSEDGISVALPANALVTREGAAPEGMVFATLRLPLRAGGSAADMPGGFAARDAAGTDVTLVSYGAVEISFRDAAEAPLDLRPGERATITIPALSVGPDAMPLWYLDEAQGLWLEEGSVTRRGDAYVGEVAHFSFWNADLACDRACAVGRLVDADGQAVGDAAIVADVETSTCLNWVPTAISGATARTAADGTFRLTSLVPASEYAFREEDRELPGFAVPATGTGCLDLGDVGGGSPPPPGPAFDLVCARWDGAREVVVRMRPESAETTHLGVLGDLRRWTNQIVIDERSERAYATGNPEMPEGHMLYTLDLATGGSHQVRVSGDCCDALGGVTSDGRVVAADVEATDTDASLVVRLIDPLSGAASAVGVLNTPGWWATDANGHPTVFYDRTRDAVFAVSRDPVRLFSLDIPTRAATSVPVSGVAAPVVLAGRAPDGSLAGVEYDGALYVVTLDPETGVATRRGALSGLFRSNFRPIADPLGGALFMFGADASETSRLYRFDFATARPDNRALSDEQRCVLARY